MVSLSESPSCSSSPQRWWTRLTSWRRAGLQRWPVCTLDSCVDCRQTRAVDGEQTWRSKERSHRDKLSHTPNYRCWFVSLSEHPSTMRFVTRFFFFNPHLSALMFWLMCVWFVRHRLCCGNKTREGWSEIEAIQRAAPGEASDVRTRSRSVRFASLLHQRSVCQSRPGKTLILLPGSAGAPEVERCSSEDDTTNSEGPHRHLISQNSTASLFLWENKSVPLVL